MAELGRGSVAWAFNRFRSDALTQLLEDLLELEERGLEPAECRRVQTALHGISGVAVNLRGDSWLREVVWTEIGKFEEVYVKWNDPPEDEAMPHREHRKNMLEELKIQRRRISRKVRPRQGILAAELDATLIANIYANFAQLAEALPSLFTHLGQAVQRYRNRA